MIEVPHTSNIDEERENVVGIRMDFVGDNETEVLRCRTVRCPIGMYDPMIVDDSCEPIT